MKGETRVEIQTQLDVHQREESSHTPVKERGQKTALIDVAEGGAKLYGEMELNYSASEENIRIAEVLGRFLYGRGKKL